MTSKIREFHDHLKNSKNYNIPQRNNWFWRRLTRWCDSARRAPSVNKTLPILKCKMAAAAILKNRKTTISQRWNDQFWQNLAQWCVSALQTLLANKILWFLKFNMAVRPFFKIEKSQYLRCGWTNHRWRSCAAVLKATGSVNGNPSFLTPTEMNGRPLTYH